jgi:hypothetical protein
MQSRIQQRRVDHVTVITPLHALRRSDFSVEQVALAPGADKPLKRRAILKTTPRKHLIKLINIQRLSTHRRPNTTQPLPQLC